MKEIKGFTKSYNHRFAVKETEEKGEIYNGFKIVRVWAGFRAKRLTGFHEFQGPNKNELKKLIDGKRTLKN